MRQFPTLLLIFYSLLLFGNNQTDTSELLNKLGKANPSEKHKIYNELIIAHINNSEDSSTYYFNKALEAYQYSKDLREKYNSYFNMTKVYKGRNLFKKAQAFLEECLSLAIRIGDQYLKCEVLISFSSLYWEMGDLPNAIAYLEKANPIAQEISNKKLLSDIHLNLGLINFELEEYETSTHSFKKALKIAEEEKNTFYVAVLLNNIAANYIYDEKYVSALAHTNLGISTLQTTDHPASKDLSGYLIKNKGEILINLDRGKEGLSYLDSAYQISTSVGSKINLIQILGVKAEYCFQEQEYTSAIDNALEGVKYSEEIEYYRNLPETCGVLADAYLAQMNYKEALKWEKREKDTQAQLEEKQNKKAVIRDELKEKEMENEILVLKNKNKENLLVIVVALFLFFLGLLYFFFQNQNRKKLEHLRLRIASDLHDTVGSNLNSITRLAKSIKVQKNETNVTHNANQIVDKANQTVSNIIDVVWSLDEEEAELEFLLDKIEEQLNNYKKLNPLVSIQFKKEGINKQAILSPIVRHHLLMITKEAIHNIQKHTEAKSIRVELSQNASDILSAKIVNSFTRLLHSTNSSGRGIKNMKKRIQELSGTLEVQKTETSFGLYLTIKI